MKKNLLTLGVLAISLSLSAQSSNVLTYVGQNALVTVTNDALVYNGGGWQNATGSKVNNTGDIMVVASATGTSEVFNVANDTFVLSYPTTEGVSSTIYGQLYIKDIAQGNITGQVRKEFKVGETGATGRQQFAVPFHQSTVGDINTQLGNYFQLASNVKNASGRFNPASVFRWNNKQIRFDQILNATTLLGKPTDYLILPRRDNTGAAVWNVSSTVNKVNGIPAGDLGYDLSAFKMEVLDKGWLNDLGSGGNKQNIYSERYLTYVNDPFENGTVATNWTSAGTYGRNLSQFANPFLTNLDLSQLGTLLPDVAGVAYYGASSLNWYYSSQAGNTGFTGTAYTSGAATIVNFVGGVAATGDVDKLVIKPLQEIMVKFKPGTSFTAGVYQTPLNLNNLRTFNSAARTAATTNPTGKMVASKTTSSAGQLVKQVAVVLLSDSNTEIARTYYAVAPSFVTGDSQDALAQGYVNNYFIYTKEEALAGGEDLNASKQLYINEANENNFKGKEIPLFLNYDGAGAKLKFELYEGGVKLDNGSTFSNGTSFYISNGNNITKINAGDQLGATSSRFGLYFEQPEGVLSNSTVAKNQTIVAKSGNDWVVRFSSGWKKANIEVYSATGQLVHSKNNVSTVNDYIIPIDNQAKGIFVVKTTGENGEIVTKKIVK